MRVTAFRYLTQEDRRELEVLYAGGVCLTDIAAKLGVHLATVYRELARGDTGQLDKNGRGGYSAALGQKRVRDSFKRRGKKRRLGDSKKVRRTKKSAKKEMAEK